MFWSQVSFCILLSSTANSSHLCSESRTNHCAECLHLWEGMAGSRQFACTKCPVCLYLLRAVFNLMQLSRAPVQAVASSDQPADASHEAAVDAWAPPQDPVAGSTNDRRVASYHTHPPRRTGVTPNAIPFGSIPAGVNNRPPVASNSTTRRQQSRPFQLANQSGQHSTSSDTSIVFKVIFMPYPVVRNHARGSD